jgi:integrase
MEAGQERTVEGDASPGLPVRTSPGAASTSGCQPTIRSRWPERTTGAYRGTSTTVQQWVKDLQAVKGLAPATVETICVIFASIMRGAVRDGYLRKTPCVDIRMPEVPKTVVRLMSTHQVVALAAAMPKRHGLLVLLGAGAGLRQGEAFGLVLDRVDVTVGMITVDQQVVVIDSRPVLAAPSITRQRNVTHQPRLHTRW